MDATSMASIIETNKRTTFGAALYAASAGSRLLASGFAKLFPFSFCAKTNCALPIAHDADHLDLEGWVVS
jgi:hypothetical protein